MLLCLLAQDEQSAIDLQVEGPSGLIATAPPHFKPVWLPSDLQLVWPNGATAYVRTPEVPGKIRGLEYQLTWMSELQSWPKATMQEAFSNVFLSTRLGYAHVLWDATPKKRHPLLLELLKEAAANPARNIVVRGSMSENRGMLAKGFVERLVKKYGGTSKGREELDGEMLEDADGALFKQAIIDQFRRPRPAKFARKVVSIDPAVTDRKGSDTTGLVEEGLGPDGIAYPLKDKSGKHSPGGWGTIALDWYIDDMCDLIIAETNKGGQLVAQNIRALAKERGLDVVVIGRDEQAPQRQPGKVFIREVYAKGAKEDRAEPVATATEKGRVAFPATGGLESLEDTLTTWEPSPTADSPGDLDAFVHATVELLDLSNDEPDNRTGFVGIVEAAKAVTSAKPSQLTLSLSQALGYGGRGDRI